MDIQSIALLLIGCLLYWLIKANTEYTTAKGAFSAKAFLANNALEFAISLLCCLALIIINNPPDAAGVKGKALILATGYSATSVIKNLLVFRKA